MHHKHLGKEEGECFGMLFIAFEIFQRNHEFKSGIVNNLNQSFNKKTILLHSSRYLEFQHSSLSSVLRKMDEFYPFWKHLIFGNHYGREFSSFYGIFILLTKMFGV